MDKTESQFLITVELKFYQSFINFSYFKRDFRGKRSSDDENEPIDDRPINQYNSSMPVNINLNAPNNSKLNRIR